MPNTDEQLEDEVEEEIVDQEESDAVKPKRKMSCALSGNLKC